MVVRVVVAGSCLFAPAFSNSQTHVNEASNRHVYVLVNLFCHNFKNGAKNWTGSGQFADFFFARFHEFFFVHFGVSGLLGGKLRAFCLLFHFVNPVSQLVAAVGAGLNDD